MKQLFRSPVFAAFLIFLVAAFFRVTALGYMEFKYDEAYTVFQLTQFFENPYLMQVGPPQSTGVFNPPLFNYLMIVLSLFSQDPQYLAFLIGLTNSIFIVVFYFVIRKYYGSTSALFSGLMLALFPWGILFSRKIWIPDLLLPFSVMILYYLHKLLLDKDKKALFPLTLFLTLVCQMHASGLFFSFVTVVVILLYKVKLDYRVVAKGILFGLIPAIPYFWRQLTSNPFCIDCVAFFKYQDGTRIFDVSNFEKPWILFNGLGFSASLGDSYQKFIQTFTFINTLNLIYLMEYLILIIAVLLIAKKYKTSLFLLVYPMLLPVLYFITRTPAIMHYFVVVLPFLAASFAWVFNSLMKQYSKKRVHVFISLVSMIFLLGNLIFDLSFRQFIQNEKIIKGDYGPAYSLTKANIDIQLADYTFVPYYNELRSFSYMFAQTEYLHSQLGSYFSQKRQIPFALNEFEKAVKENPNDLFSRSNLIYLYALTNKFDLARSNLKILSTQDPSATKQLEELISKIEKQQKF